MSRGNRMRREPLGGRVIGHAEVTKEEKLKSEKSMKEIDELLAKHKKEQN